MRQGKEVNLGEALQELSSRRLDFLAVRLLEVPLRVVEKEAEPHAVRTVHVLARLHSVFVAIKVTKVADEEV